MKKKLLLATLSLTICSFAVDDDFWKKAYVSAEQKIPSGSMPLMERSAVKVQIPGVGTFHAGKFLQKKNLAGEWLFSGLKTSELPFASNCPADELPLMAENFDDSHWEKIKVPTNWWTTEKYSYKKVFRPSRKTNIKSQAYNRRTSNPYCKGIYRHTIELPQTLPGQVGLEFHAIGYEAELFVNGKLAGHHHGDFHTWHINITNYVKPGKNTIALRVLADLGPHDEIYTHVYGAAWTNECIKGGLWDHVFLNCDSSIFEINSMKIAADSRGNFELHYQINYPHDTPDTFIPGIAVANANVNAAIPTAREFPPITLKKGLNQGVLKYRFNDIKPWELNDPQLYYSTLYFRNRNSVRASRIERFGFRDFKINGSRFFLNGKEVFLSIETAQSMRFSGDKGDVRERIREYKVKGVNMLRTAHQPVTPRLIEAADEMGMMIYDEWALGSYRNIVPELFLKRNLKELASFVSRDHNNPSVVMWLLGNEVEHRTNKHIHKLLDDQYDTVKKIDIQKRPIASFAGVGNLHHYGYDKLKTDVIDYHLYTGITRPALRWEEDFSRYVDMTAKVYGKNGTLTMPIVISEAIGGGWGHRPDKNYKHGNIDRYLEIINRSFYWGNPGAAGYSGAVGVRSVLDPDRQYKYIWCINGTRIVEMARQDERIAGFGTWIGHPTEHSTRWTQSIYPGLRFAPDKKFPILQYFSPGKTKVNFFIRNQGQTELANASCRLDVARDGKIIPLQTIELGALPSGKRLNRNIEIQLPELPSGQWELRLTVLENGKETNFRNSYCVQLHPRPIALRNPGKALLLVKNSKVEKILSDLGIPYTIFSGKESFNSFKCLIIPPNIKSNAIANTSVADYIEKGGQLLILEQRPGTMPVFGNYSLSADDNTMVETVVESHPVFKDLRQADFDIWAQNTKANVIENVILPLDVIALAVKGRFLDEKGAGTAIAEGRYGKGRVFFSQVCAVNLWGINPSASRYLKNVFDYLLTTPNEKLVEARPLQLTGGYQVNTYPIAHERIFKINLRPYANNSFIDEKAGDGKGWTDQGPFTDMRNIPTGNQEVAGIPFDIIDPTINNGNTCITLKGGNLDMPTGVNNIAVNCKVNSIAFLHTSGFGGGITPHAVYTINYADNTSVKYVAVGGKNIGDWWQPARKTEAIPGLIRKNGLGVNCGFYVARWENPFPEKTVKSFDFSVYEQGRAIPILAAATAELVHPEPLMLANFADAKWGLAADKKGKKGTAVTMKDEKPYYSRLVMPATTPNGGFTASILFCFYDVKKFQNNTYDYISFEYRSKNSGKIDLVIPRIDHRSKLVHSFELQNSAGKWIRVRLNLKQDFELIGTEFDIHSMRKEVIFYNGFNKKAGFPRNEVIFDIRGLRLE